MKKSVLALILAAVMVFALTACKNDGKENMAMTDNEGSKEEKVVERFLDGLQGGTLGEYSEYFATGDDTPAEEKFEELKEIDKKYVAAFLNAIGCTSELKETPPIGEYVNKKIVDMDWSTESLGDCMVVTVNIQMPEFTATDVEEAFREALKMEDDSDEWELHVKKMWAASAGIEVQGSQEDSQPGVKDYDKEFSAAYKNKEERKEGMDDALQDVYREYCKGMAERLESGEGSVHKFTVENIDGEWKITNWEVEE